MLIFSFSRFVTLAGFHALNFGMFKLAKDYAARGMAAYAELQVGGVLASRLRFTF